MTRYLTLITVTAMLFAVGCDDSSTPSSAGASTANSSLAAAPQPLVGVVDLDHVAEETGRLQDITVALQNRNAQFDERIRVAKDNLQALVNKQVAVAEEDEEITDDESAQLTNLANAANQRLQAGRQQAKQLIAALRNQLIAQYQKEMKPYVASAARQRGLNVVLVETYPVMYGAAQVDITDDVIEAYITNRPEPVASTGTTTPTTPVDTDSVSEAVIDAVGDAAK